MMPWTSSDAQRHTKKARSPAAQQQWSSVANSVFGKIGDEGQAVRIANAAVAKRQRAMAAVLRRKK